MSIFGLPAFFYKKVSAVVSDVRRQAPGAKMVGEFAVKHVANETVKKFNEVSKPTHVDTPPTNQ